LKHDFFVTDDVDNRTDKDHLPGDIYGRPVKYGGGVMFFVPDMDETIWAHPEMQEKKRRVLLSPAGVKSKRAKLDEQVSQEDLENFGMFEEAVKDLVEQANAEEELDRLAEEKPAKDEEEKPAD